MPEQTEIPEDKPLTMLEQKLADEYIRTGHITNSAKYAGYSEKTAHQLGSVALKKANVKAYVRKRMAELQMASEEVTKIISDIAKGNMADYFNTRQVEHTPRIKVGLAQVIQQLKDDITFETEFIEFAPLSKREKRSYEAAIKDMETQILRYEIQLERNPNAMKIVSGETVMVNQQYLDIEKILADKERGRIKSVTPTEFGLKVEMYSAIDALGYLAKINGLFAKDNDQKKPDAGAPMSQTQFDALLKQARDQAKRQTDKSK